MTDPLPDNVLPLPGLGLSHPSRNQLTRVRRDDPDTSHHAKLDAYPRSGSRKARALEAFWRQWCNGDRLASHVMAGKGLTDYELSMILDCLRGSASKVRGLLEEGGWVRDSGHRRPTDTGSLAVVWTLTDQGVRFMELLHG